MSLLTICFIDIIPSCEYNNDVLGRIMKYISATEVAKKWNISRRRIITLCNEGRIADAQKAGSYWIVPENAVKPADARIKNGKYIKKEGGGTK